MVNHLAIAFTGLQSVHTHHVNTACHFTSKQIKSHHENYNGVEKILLQAPAVKLKTQ